MPLRRRQRHQQIKLWMESLAISGLGHCLTFGSSICLFEDDIKERWIHCNDPKSIQEIDARNSNVRAENASELIASLWNSPDFNPTTMISRCHVDFSTVIDIGFQATADFARATPTKVKDKLAKMKTDLTLIIQKWERSGQGDDGRLNEDDDDDNGSGSGSQTTNEDRFE